ncbi:AAA domain-containing protein, partial [Ochromonadaceae sp. CCMP2298]
AGGAGTGAKIRVLICAPSNTAVDEVVFRLVTQGLLGTNGEETVVRVVERVTMDNLVEERRAAVEGPGYGAAPPIRIQAIRKQLLEAADVVCCTLSGAGSQPLLEMVLHMPDFAFDAVIIDEAAQAVEPSCLIPLKYNPRAVILVGDPCQLPATVFSRAAKGANYSQSLFQRLQLAGHPVLMLDTQFRMHPAIAAYPSQRFYQGRLKTAPSVLTGTSHAKPYHSDPSGRFKPLLFHDVDSYESQEGSSTCNTIEAQYVLDLYLELVRRYPEHRAGVGIIAPYRAQRRLLTNMFAEHFEGKGREGNGREGRDGREGHSPRRVHGDLGVEVSTVDGFQGREKSIVIFSCVRAPPRHRRTSSVDAGVGMGGGMGAGVGGAEPSRGIGFLKEWQRLNVAITRARYALWIVGHGATLRTDKEWDKLLTHSTICNSSSGSHSSGINSSITTNSNNTMGHISSRRDRRGMIGRGGRRDRRDRGGRR